MTNHAALQNRCVWVTRPKERSLALCFLLEEEGAEVVCVPMLEVLPPEDSRPLLAAAEQLHRFQWVFFASPAAVEALDDAARQAKTLQHIEKVRCGVVGPQTARVAQSLGWKVELEPEEATGSALLKVALAKLVSGDNVLLPVAEQGRTELYDGLLEEGFSVTRVVAYRSEPTQSQAELQQALAQRAPDVVLFSSPRAAQAFVETPSFPARSVLEKSKVVAIGPTSAHALSALGIRVDAWADAPTPEGLVDAAARALG